MYLLYNKYRIYFSLNSKFTLIGTHGYSGNAAATALAPASFVHCDRPTKNSFPNSKINN